MDPATLKFRQALPFSVFPVSPQLAALHTLSHPTTHSCPSCGSFLTTHLAVVRNRQLSRVIKTTCDACGRIHSTPLHKGNATIFPSRKQRANPIRSHTTQSSPSSSEQSPPTSRPSIKSSKPLSTKAFNKQSKLHDMLKRNREKEQNRSKIPEPTSGGLSAFLSTL